MFPSGSVSKGMAVGVASGPIVTSNVPPVVSVIVMVSGPHGRRTGV